jgi:hypothetical protein
MERPRLATKEAEALRDRIRPMLHFLYKCRRRLDALGIDAKGPIYEVIDKAFCATHELHITLHYESCGRGVGKASDKQPDLTPPAEQAKSRPDRPGGA